MFKNNGNAFFENVAEAWGLDHPTYSSGATYVDLNNNGALDLVINNVNEESFIYRNRVRERNPDSNYLKVRFDGPKGNRFGIGSKLTIPRDDGSVMIRELYLSRGFQSSVEPVLHAGLDSLEVIPELIVEWPGG
jgi:enediyne biosynthesis protein E4